MQPISTLHNKALLIYNVTRNCQLNPQNINVNDQYMCMMCAQDVIYNFSLNRFQHKEEDNCYYLNIKELYYDPINGIPAYDNIFKTYVFAETAIKQENGLKHTFACLECNKEVILKKGEVKRPHFAHKPDDTNKCKYYERKKFIDDRITLNYHTLAICKLHDLFMSGALLMIKKKCSKLRSSSFNLMLNNHINELITIQFSPTDILKKEYKYQQYCFDLVILDKEGKLKYIFEIFNTHKTTNPRPIEYYEIRALEIINCRPSLANSNNNNFNQTNNNNFNQTNNNSNQTNQTNNNNNNFNQTNNNSKSDQIKNSQYLFHDVKDIVCDECREHNLNELRTFMWSNDLNLMYLHKYFTLFNELDFKDMIKNLHFLGIFNGYLSLQTPYLFLFKYVNYILWFAIKYDLTYLMRHILDNKDQYIGSLNYTFKYEGLGFIMNDNMRLILKVEFDKLSKFNDSQYENVIKHTEFETIHETIVEFEALYDLGVKSEKIFDYITYYNNILLFSHLNQFSLAAKYEIKLKWLTNAVVDGNLEVVEYIILNSHNTRTYNSYLYLAHRNKRMKVVDFLLKHGWSYNETLDYATKFNRKDIVDYLKRLKLV